MFSLLLGITIAFGSNAFGIDVKSCFSGVEGHEFSFLRNLQDLEIETSDLIASVSTACKELQEKPVATSLRGQIFFTLRSTLFTDPWSSFTVLPNDDSYKGVYKRELEKIRFIDNRIVRIREVYKLAVQFQKKYDDKKLRKDDFIYTFTRGSSLPTSVLTRAEESGMGGVCDDFSSLLYWSLLQVARSPKENLSLGVLGPKSFNVKRVYGDDHAWIEVLLPVQESKGMIFERVQLDSTYYESFILLSPREEKQNDGEILNGCLKVKECLLKGASLRQISSIKPIKRPCK